MSKEDLEQEEESESVLFRFLIYFGCSGSSLLHTGTSLVAGYGPGCPRACQILVSNQGSDLHPPLWKADS